MKLYYLVAFFSFLVFFHFPGRVPRKRKLKLKKNRKFADGSSGIIEIRRGEFR